MNHAIVSKLGWARRGGPLGGMAGSVKGLYLGVIRAYARPRVFMPGGGDQAGARGCRGESVRSYDAFKFEAWRCDSC